MIGQSDEFSWELLKGTKMVIYSKHYNVGPIFLDYVSTIRISRLVRFSTDIKIELFEKM